MKKILIITALYTGGGHKSITDALRVELGKMDPDACIDCIDGFDLGGGFGRSVGKMYDKLATYTPPVWAAIYGTLNHAPVAVNTVTAAVIKKRLIEQIRNIKPDIIVSVNAAFVGSVLKVLDAENSKTPLISVIADLDNVNSLWADNRAEYIFCPTNESLETMARLGVPREKLKLFGFPVRQEFCAGVISAKSGSKHEMTAMIISGSQGSLRIIGTAMRILKHSDCRVCIVTGKNAVLKRTLERRFARVPGNRVEVYGFIPDLWEYMRRADFLVARASPNVLMEAVNMCKPIIVNGSFRGQEKKNPEFVRKNRIGLTCTGTRRLARTVDALTANDGKMLDDIARRQARFRKPFAAEEMARVILDTCDNGLSGGVSGDERPDIVFSEIN